MSTVNVALVGIGNCASSLVQGVEYYRDTDYPECAGFAVRQVAFTAAFDVTPEKIGKDLSEAVWAAPNNAAAFARVPYAGVPVEEGILGEDFGDLAGARGGRTPEQVAGVLRATGTHVVVSYLPVGHQRATELYAEAALLAGCAFVNCMPAVLARAPEWAGRFERAGLPLVGDDLKSQFGSTLVHRALVDALTAAGVRLRSTYQLNAGGNMDFQAMQDPARMAGKKATKAQGMAAGRMPDGGQVHVGAEHVPFLRDRKVAYIRIDGEAFGGTPLEIELRMSVEDSPSAAGNTLDAVRHARRAMLEGRGGVLNLGLMKA
ncbi:inositol-3-phosphate synthase [Nonomuraea sp. NPDC003804]|uniref:inositol-3-phosphate synthase n=1 Tax=Nonomuraea sp. NPDC003804 TaxID=3154547 RepID=UPI0033BD82AD